MRTAAQRAAYAVVVLTWLAAGPPEAAEERRNWFDTPFDQAVSGAAGCPRPEGPLITADEMRQQAHGRIERGTSCWLAKKCEDSNVYRRDPEIQARVLQAIRSEPLAARSSVWLTTERRYVTLQGCVESTRVRRVLIERVRTTDGVDGVFDQLIIGTRRAPRWTVDPAWRPGSR
jgi:BON domain